MYKTPQFLFIEPSLSYLEQFTNKKHFISSNRNLFLKIWLRFRLVWSLHKNRKVHVPRMETYQFSTNYVRFEYLYVFKGGDIQLQRHSIFYKYLKRSVYEGFARYHSIYARLLEMELLSNVTLEHLNIHYSTCHSIWPNFEYQSTVYPSLVYFSTFTSLKEGNMIIWYPASIWSWRCEILISRSMFLKFTHTMKSGLDCSHMFMVIVSFFEMILKLWIWTSQ